MAESLKRRSNRTLRMPCLVAIAALATVGLATVGAGAQTTNAPGVTAKTVKIGFIYNGTGAAASTFKNSAKAFQARIDRANAQGGVNGRKIQTEIVDDQTGGANLTGAQDLVQNRKVFAVVNNSGVGFLSYRYLLNAGVPMIGGGYDGSYYSQKGNENVITALGYLIIDGLVSNGVPKVMKQLGATKTAAISYSVGSSGSAAHVFQDYAVPSVGLKAVYTNTSVDLGSSDVGSIVLGIKNAGADAVYLPMVASTNLAIVQGLQQNNVQVKTNILATGYGQDLLDSPAAQILTDHDLLATQNVPVELKTKATKQFQADLKKYADFTGVPDYGWYTGYITGDLAVLGLELAGKTPTRQGFVDGIRKHGVYDGAGLLCTPFDLSLAGFGKQPTTSCGYYLTVKNGKFVVFNKGKPVSGKLVGLPEVLKANETGTAAAVTTTTPAP